MGSRSKKTRELRPTSTAQRNWENLPPGEQLRIALTLARDRQRQWRRCYVNVMNIGAGFRTKGRKTTEPDPDKVVLRFIVTAKRKTVKKGRIPPFIRAFWNDGRRRQLLAVPTDVFAHHPGCLHSRFIGTTPDAQHLFGSACCVLSDTSAAKYLLSCHHVFTGSDLSDTLEPIPGTQITRNDLLVGPCVLAGTLRPAPGDYAMDAAFLELNQPTSQNAIAGFWNQIKPARLAQFGEVPDGSQDCGIFSFRGMLPAHFVGVFPDMEVDLKQGVRVKFQYVIETMADTQPGDSGSALMGFDGVVYGLHFYGGSSPQSGKLYSLAIPVWTIVGAENFFRRNLTLLKPHP